MLESLFIYTVGVYFFYHLLSRSDLLEKPRTGLIKILPKWFTYPLSCCFCFTFWSGWFVFILQWVTTGLFVISPTMLLAAPVINFVLDLVVRALIRVNEQPILISAGDALKVNGNSVASYLDGLASGKTITSGDQSISTWEIKDLAPHSPNSTNP